jgi:PAS domain S-box-containing protein
MSMSHRSNIVRYGLAIVAAASSAGASVALQSRLGYPFPLITFCPAIMLTAWYGGFWPGVAATGVSTLLVDYLWLAPLRNDQLSTAGDLAAHVVFVGVGLLISGFSESLHRSSAREHLARIRAEERQQALGESERRLRASEARLAADATALARLNALSSQLWRIRSRREGLEEMLATTMELLGADMGTIQLLDPERGVLTIAAQRGFTKDFLDVFREVTANDNSASGRSLRSRERIVIEDVESDFSYAPLRLVARAAGYRAVQSTPLLDRDGRPLGLLSTHWRSVHTPSDQHLVRLDLYARQAADFIDRCRTEEALRESGRRLQLALESGRMGTWEWSIATGKVVWSRSLEAIHGLEPGTFGGTFEAYQQDIHPDDAEQVRSSIARTLETGEDHFVEYRIVWPDGSLHWVEGRGSVVKSSHGALVGMTGICIDVTARKRAEEARRQIEVELRNANRLKDEFLATLSHELRTPLNAVLGWAQMLRSGTLRANAEGRALESLERNARVQVQLVDDLLDMSGIISGKLHIKSDAIDLETVIADAIDTARAAAIQKAVSLEVNIEGPGRTTVAGDATRLRQIVSNLVLNAVKFTPSGGRIQVSLSRRDSKAEIMVRDTGEGIEPQFLPFVFERFRQADAGTTRRHGGLGLGLAIVKHLTEAHGGTVTADSDGIGKGATFTVRLPLAAPSRKNVPETTTRLPGSATALRLGGVRVCAVDDERDARDLLRAILESHVAEVSIVESAEQALQAIRDGTFDVLIADIGMPEHDGFWLIHAIRHLSHPQRQIPAIAVTAYAAGREREMALEAGYTVHLAKPFDADELVVAIASALRCDRNTQLSI